MSRATKPLSCVLGELIMLHVAEILCSDFDVQYCVFMRLLQSFDLQVFQEHCFGSFRRILIALLL